MYTLLLDIGKHKCKIRQSDAQAVDLRRDVEILEARVQVGVLFLQQRAADAIALGIWRFVGESRVCINIYIW